MSEVQLFDLVSFTSFFFDVISSISICGLLFDVGGVNISHKNTAATSEGYPTAICW
jgi:hypothetical protein